MAKKPANKKPVASKPAAKPKKPRSRNVPVVQAEVTACGACGSTDRQPYFNVRERAIAGVRDGKPFTHVLWKRTRCTNCGQIRDDRSYENRLNAPKRRAA